MSIGTKNFRLAGRALQNVIRVPKAQSPSPVSRQPEICYYYDMKEISNIDIGASGLLDGLKTTIADVSRAVLAALSFEVSCFRCGGLCRIPSVGAIPIVGYHIV